MDDDPFLDYYYNHEMLLSPLENGDCELTVGEDDNQIKSDEVDFVQVTKDVKGDADDDAEKVVSYDDTFFSLWFWIITYYEDYEELNALILQYEITTNTALSRKRYTIKLDINYTNVFNTLIVLSEHLLVKNVMMVH